MSLTLDGRLRGERSARRRVRAAGSRERAGSPWLGRGEGTTESFQAWQGLERQRASKGCIRIPATLNIFIDRYGLLDAAYEEAMAVGREFWVLRSERRPTPWPGRYLVVIESPRSERPVWSPAPRTHMASIALAGPGSC